jgi:hypothetical protein
MKSFDTDEFRLCRLDVVGAWIGALNRTRDGLQIGWGNSPGKHMRKTLR